MIEISDLEPIDGAAVDERWEHPQTVAEGISNWTHGKHNVEVGLHPLDEVVVHR